MFLEIELRHEVVQLLHNVSPTEDANNWTSQQLCDMFKKIKVWCKTTRSWGFQHYRDKQQSNGGSVSWLLFGEDLASWRDFAMRCRRVYVWSTMVCWLNILKRRLAGDSRCGDALFWHMLHIPQLCQAWLVVCCSLQTLTNQCLMAPVQSGLGPQIWSRCMSLT